MLGNSSEVTIMVKDNFMRNLLVKPTEACGIGGIEIGSTDLS